MRACDRDIADTMGQKKRSLLVAALLAGSLVLNLIPLWSGADPYKSWAFDEIRPWHVLGDEAWPEKYPPLYRAMARVIILPLDLARPESRDGWPEEESLRTCLLLMRLLNVFFATATVWLVYRIGVRLGGWRAGWLAGAAIALSPSFVYYAKVANLDAPYLFFFATSVLSAVRWLDRRTLADAVAMTVFAAAAITTKTTAAALYPLWPLAFFFVYRQSKQSPDETTRRPHPARDGQLWLALLIGCVALTLFFELPWRLEDFREHIDALLARGVEGRGRGRDWPNTVPGHIGLLAEGVGRWAFVLGAPVAVSAIAGLALFLRWRESRAAALLVVLSMTSQYWLYIARIGFAPERYYLPLALMGAVTAGYALSRLTTLRGAARVTAAVVVTLALGWSAARAVAVDLLMLRDSRLQAESWLRTQRDGDSALAIGRFQLLPRDVAVRPWRWLRRDRCGRLASRNSSLVLVCAEDGRSPGDRNTLRLILDGHSGLQPIRMFPRPAWSQWFIRRGQGTNLTKISPTIVALSPSAEPCRDRGWAVHEAGQLLRAPEPRRLEVLTDFLTNYDHAGRRTLLPGLVFATGVDLRGWTYGDAPAAVALTNSTSEAWRPRVEVKGYVATAEDPQPIHLLLDGQPRRLSLTDRLWHRLEIAALAPGDRRLLLIHSERFGSPSPGSRKRFGVRTRILPPKAETTLR